ncbi:MAG: Ig domain-containing protein [Selenomonadaceae bacterium]|nr:Ig domain-containing protein [Selenomonadaceae bacterium]
MKKFFSLVIFCMIFLTTQITSAEVQFYYQAHVQNYGWRPNVQGGEVAGSVGEGLRMEALRIIMTDNSRNMIQYCAHVENYGWLDWQYSGGIAGTVGRGLRMEAVRIRLEPYYAKYFDVYYRTHVENGGWLGWAKNGEPAGTAGASLRMEAVQISLVPRGSHFNRGGEAFFEKRNYPQYY